MRVTSYAAGAAFLLLFPLDALAQDGDRYTLEKSQEGYVRLDRQTGEMSLCQERSGQLVCKVAADERSAFQDELDRLQTKVGELEKRLAALETGTPARPDALLPSEEDFEKSLSYMERFFNRFMDIVRGIERNFGGEAQEGTPQRT